MLLPDNIREALSVLTSHGFEAYTVGGCVRDFAMGIIPHDYDLAASAAPDEIIACFSGYKTIETGKKHGTVTVVINGENIEITSFRIDGEYADNRHPDSVTFTRSLSDDLSRRDFTVNAMAYSDSTGIIDFFGGIEHIRKRIISCVGEPDKRFNEDGLRILRALRFASVLGFSIDKETSDSIHRNKELLSNISKERIFAELVKMICGQNIRQIMADYSDVFGVIIPELKVCIGFDQRGPKHLYDVYMHIANAVSLMPDDKICRLTALLHDIGKPPCFTLDENGIGHFDGHARESEQMANDILHRFNADNDTIQKVCELIGIHDIALTPDEKYARRLLCKISQEQAQRLMQMKFADISSLAPSARSKLSEIDVFKDILDEVTAKEGCFTLKSLVINGNDLVSEGFPKNRLLGQTLEHLLDKVIDGEIKNEKSVLLAEARIFYLSQKEQP